MERVHLSWLLGSRKILRSEAWIRVGGNLLSTRNKRTEGHSFAESTISEGLWCLCSATNTMQSVRRCLKSVFDSRVDLLACRSYLLTTHGSTCVNGHCLCRVRSACFHAGLWSRLSRRVMCQTNQRWVSCFNRNVNLRIRTRSDVSLDVRDEISLDSIFPHDMHLMWLFSSANTERILTWVQLNDWLVIL